MIIFSRWLLALIWLLAESMAQAGGINVPISVAPVTVKLSLANEYSNVEVSNRGETSTGIEVEIMRVQWRDGLEVYEKTSDFIASPPAFRLAAGKSRLIRFHYSGQRGDVEGFYRLYIRQLPEATTGNQINLVVNIGVPIFVEPATTRVQLSIGNPAKSAADAIASTGARYELRNTGNVTLTLIQVEGSRCVDGLQKIQGRLAPLQKLLLDKDAAQCATAVQTDRGLISLTPLAVP